MSYYWIPNITRTKRHAFYKRDDTLPWRPHDLYWAVCGYTLYGDDITGLNQQVKGWDTPECKHCVKGMKRR